MEKSSIAEIRERFDNDVERFSNINTGQVSTIDAKLALDIITDTAKKIVPDAKNLLDIGCGAGNYTIKMLHKIPYLNCTLVDLSKPMLDKATERLSKEKVQSITAIQNDIREADLEENHYDIILAGMVLHHLRDDQDWENTFKKLYRLLKSGGSLMISDMVTQENNKIQEHIWSKYGHYLEQTGGKEYQQKVFAYTAKEDSPRPLTYQLNLMKKVGFKYSEVLHKNLCFSAYCGIK